MSNEQNQNQKTTAITAGQEAINYVTTRVRSFVQNGELCLPRSYSVENALKAAWLILQTTVDKDKHPVLEACAKASISFSLLDMVIQGLNPAKKQCYFIAYGKQLTCMRSYHGSRAVTMQLCGASDVDAQVVWEGDEFEYEIVRGVKRVVCHKQKLANVGKNPQGAYCIISWPDGKEYTDIMTMDQVKKAWAKSKMDPDSKSSVHSQFAEEMIKKTITNRACKKFINSSSDNHLFLQSFNRSDEVSRDEEMTQELESNANKQLIDVQSGEVLDVQQGQESEPELVGAVCGNVGNGHTSVMEGPDF
ncbi:MAG TPA: RecT family recombinase [Desulfatiglandales bacterium]|nr:RecT family recombinase [Desulfatiglandales bacterium]